MVKKVKSKSKKNTKYKPVKIEPDQLILQARQILLYGDINEGKAEVIVKQFLALDYLSKQPIVLWINSGGGSVYDGFSIIDIMKSVKSSITTIIIGRACSMAGLISIVGDKRYITKNSIWMAHDLSTTNSDYASKFLLRAEHVKQLQKTVFSHLSEYTKLSQANLNKARNEELWICAEECQKKGIVDAIIK